MHHKKSWLTKKVTMHKRTSMTEDTQMQYKQLYTNLLIN